MNMRICEHWDTIAVFTRKECIICEQENTIEELQEKIKLLEEKLEEGGEK